MGYLRPRSAQIRLDSTGAGTVPMSIDNTNQRWIVDGTSVRTNQPLNSTPVPRCLVYLNQISEQGFIGGTNSGNMDTATGRVILYPDDVLYFVWAGGRVGDTATAILSSGTFTPAGVPLRD